MDAVQRVSAVTGLPIGPAYLDLRDRVPRDFSDDQEVIVQDHVKSPANMATLTMNDPRMWWAIHDVSDVVDPFEVTTGDRLYVPARERVEFEYLNKGRGR